MGEPDCSEAVFSVSGSNRTNDEHLKIMAIAVLGMVVKGLDFERRDLIKLGYAKRPILRTFKSLRRAKVLKKITRKNYALRDWVFSAVRKLAAEDIGRPVGWPSIHNFLFVTYGMFDWDERRMDAFLSFLKEDWLHRMRASGRLERSPGGEKDARMDEDARTFSMKEASAMLGVTVRTIERWNDRGKIHCVSLSTGARRKVPGSEIRRILSDRSYH